MNRNITIFLIDPQSYSNLELYDKNLLKNINCKEKILLGNTKFEDKSISNFKFKSLYNYSDKKHIFKFFSYLISQIKLLFILKYKQPEIIHFQWFRLPSLDYIFLKIIKILLPESKIIFTAHNVLPHNTGNKYKTIYNKIYDLIDGIIVHTNRSKEEIEDRFNIYDKIRVIPHGLLELNYDENNTNKIKNEVYENNNLDDKIVLGFIGSIRKNKGIELLIDIWEENNFLNSNKEIILLISGSCKSDKLSNRIKEMNDYNNVIIDIRFLPLDNFAAYMKVADIILLPYLNISQSGVLLSVLAEEKPVLVSDRGGLTDPFEVGKIGWVIEPNKSDLKECLREIINNKNEIRKIKNDEELWTKVKQYYSWKDIGKKTTAFYKSLLH
jgi:glycosyltransferase involved in cell wall biosynthesis